MKTDGIDSFIEILNKQLLLNEKLLNLAFEKQDVIKANDVARLNGIVLEEQNIVKEIIFLEKNRAISVENIQRDLGIKKAITNVKEVVKKVSKDRADKIIDISTRLRTVLDKLKVQNDLNNELVKISLDYIDLNVNIFKSMVSNEPKTYGKKAYENGGDGSIFDSKY
ncbi:flagellar protein FlgN [Peptostreptococcaceae bacterium AGR-M142]